MKKPSILSPQEIAIKLMDSSKQVLQSKARSSSLANLVLLHVFFHNMNDEDLFIHWKIEWPITQLMLNHSNIELLQSILHHHKNHKIRNLFISISWQRVQNYPHQR